jgi:hypothetical protein
VGTAAPTTIPSGFAPSAISPTKGGVNEMLAKLEAKHQKELGEWIDKSERPKCAYCSFGDDELHTLDELRAHIASCPHHPLTKELAALAEAVLAWDAAVRDHPTAEHFNTTCERCRAITAAESSIVALARAAREGGET